MMKIYLLRCVIPLLARFVRFSGTTSVAIGAKRTWLDLPLFPPGRE
jgi:hypothetical protein